VSVLPFLPLILFAAGALLSRSERLSHGFAVAGALSTLAAVVATGGVFESIWTVGSEAAATIGFRLDRLSSTFLVISAISWLAVSIPGLEGKHPRSTRTSLGMNMAFFGIYLVLTAADTVLFLTGWEIMTVFAFIAMTPHVDEPRKVFRFLAFGELSALLLALGSAVLFATDHTLSLIEASAAPAAFVILSSLAVVVKMDVAPFHTWMRESYERLPGRVAALMSVGVTLAGVYGLQRFLGEGAVSQWWLLTLTLVGALSAFWGALQAAVARGLRNVPAFSTVEYNGMILCAAGISAMAASGETSSLQYLSSFAAGGVVVLSLSHALAKSLLFTSIGHAADDNLFGPEAIDGGIGDNDSAPPRAVTRIEDLRGLWSRGRRLPALGIAVGGLSFAAFPPLIGFVGEWMLLETTFQSFRFSSFAERFVASLSGVFLALAMGMIAFAMTKYIGYVVMGNETGSRPSSTVNRPTRRSLLSAGTEIALMVLLVGTGVALPLVLMAFGQSSLLNGLLGVPKPLLLVSGVPLFGVVSPTFFAVLIVVLSGIPVAVWSTRRKSYRTVEAWHGGIEQSPAERFTSDAFSQILAHILRAFTRASVNDEGGNVSLQTKDGLEGAWGLLKDALDVVGTALSRLYMNGRIAWYVGYILITFVVVLIVGTV